MNIQRSFEGKRGALYLVGTPIGNLEDITLRALKILKESDFIAAEDTRNTQKLLNHFDLKKPLISYHEHNKESSGHHIVQALREGKMVALVSDAGMPAISDPGYELVEAAIKENIPVISIPGANAALTGLIASGLSPQPFYFYGFLPRKRKEREAELQLLKGIRATIIFYEAPHRIKEMAADLFRVFGNRRVTVARELTKRYEEYARGTAEEIVEWLTEREPRGEFCFLVEGATEKEDEPGEIWWTPFSVVEHVHYYVKQGYSPKEAIKQTAVDRNMPKREVYQAYHIGK